MGGNSFNIQRCFNFVIILLMFVQPILTESEPYTVCGADQFQCGELHRGKCIPYKAHCDGTADCEDKSDERECPEGLLTCNPKDFFRCNNSRCIPKSYLCDNQNDCKDGSDEKNCTLKTCGKGQFTCKYTRECIPDKMKCDGVDNCIDGSDESTCKIISTDHICQASYRKCDNGQCLHPLWYCNGFEDCLDGSDEPPGCEPMPCKNTTEFMCENRKCVPKEFLCDGEDDCNDSFGDSESSDELTSTCASNLKCKENEFHCVGTLKCIDVSKLCETRNDCADGSDEGPGCTFSKCNHTCKHKCQKYPSGGGRCVCPTGYRLADDQFSCKDINECEDYKQICSQYCNNTMGSYSCSCIDGYILADDKAGCKLNDSKEDELLFVDVKQIKRYYLKSRLQKPLFTNLSRGVALDFDSASGRLFYTDVMKNVIYSSLMHEFAVKVEQETAIIDTGLAVPDGIAVDWIGKNIYFSESSANRIDIARFDGSSRTALISTNLTSPRGLALDPRHGYLFISDWGGTAKILRSQMDGSNLIILVTEKVGWPNGITLDYAEKKVYWVDARYDYIDSIDYDGTNRRNIIKGTSFIPHPFALSILDDYIYATDWVKMGVVKINKLLNQGKKDYEVILKNLSRPMDIQVISARRQPISANPCSNRTNKCQHMCVIKSENESTCFCQARYQLQSDGHSCVLVKTFLIFARSWEVRGISLDTDYPHDVMVPILGLSSAVGTDYDALDEHIYFSDVKSDKIGRFYIGKDSGSHVEWIIEDRLDNPDGLAVDWVGRNLYWTDSKVLENSEIGVSRLDGSFRKTLISKPLGKPRAIVVYPDKGFLFYTDWLAPAKICRLNMDGTDLKVLVNGPGLGWPNGLSIDYDSQRIFWADAKVDRIESIALDGTDRRIIISKTRHSFGLAVDHNYIYWTDWLSKSIMRANKTNVNDTAPFRRNHGALMEIQIYDNTLQKASNVCWNTNSNETCEQLCLLHPTKGYTCACGANYYLRLDNRTCQLSSKPVVKPSCIAGYFQCADGQCIKSKWVCDGDKDCLDGSDENITQCANRTCSEQSFQCENKQCIPRSWLCDRVLDCPNGTDEKQPECKIDTCNNNQTQFRCKDGGCTSKRWLCDGKKDCKDGSDEESCGPKNCTSLQFQCLTNTALNQTYNASDYFDNVRRGECIPKGWQCDRTADCADGSDENILECKSFHQCQNNSLYQYCNNGLCLSVDAWCNGENDCGDWSDEKYCKNFKLFNKCSLENKNSTRDNCSTCKLEGPGKEFVCNESRECIPYHQRCDFHIDCNDVSDEKDCPPTPECGPKEFRCANGHCILDKYQCDGKDDCHDNSDEIYCDAKMIKDLWDCGNKTKIPFEKVCDGKKDCSNDEGPLCKLKECENGNGGCFQICHNTPGGSQCSCLKGFKLANDTFTCEDINECENDPCDQVCYNTKGSYRCKCTNGFTLRDNGKTCRAGNPQPLILFSDHKEVRQLNPSTGLVKTLVGSLKSAIGIDFHWGEQMLYWSDVSEDKIERMHFNGTKREEIINQGMNSPEGLAIDWIANNIYWTDMRLDTIEAARTDGSMRSIIISNDLDAPRALALDPKAGLMFWTDWGRKPRIERADMDGENRKILTDEDVIWPNGLTVDLPTWKVFFMDARLDTLSSMTYDGDLRKVIIKQGLIDHPFALSIFEEYVYFTDWTPGSIRRINKHDGSGKVKYTATLKKPMDIQVLHPMRQPTDITYKNHCQTHLCSHLCVLKPNGYSCKCPFGRQLKNNTNQCESVKNVLLYARRNEIRGISLNPNDTVDKITPITGTQNAIGIDYHYEKQLIYWTDVSRDSISRIFLNGSGRQDIFPSGLPGPDGIAIDWIADNMYWTDAETDKIEVARLDGRFRKVIISTKLLQPRAIALYPQKGLIIWSDWGKKNLEIARLDGSGRRILIETGIGYPNGVTIDMQKDRVYWCDAQFDSISSVKLDGTDRQPLQIMKKKDIVHPFGIAVFNGFVYWSDWGKRAILRISTNGGQVVTLRENYLSLMGLRIYHKDRQTGTNACANKTLCQHLCFALNEKEYKCGCATGFVLDVADNSSCIGAKSFLLYSTTKDVRAIPFGNDNESESIIPITGLKSSYAIDFYNKTGEIFITDDGKNAIYKVKQDGGGKLEPIITTGLDKPQGIAVDWVAENLYWTDDGTNLIEVSRLNGSHRLVVINTNLYAPRSIALYPAKGLMFWTDWGSQNPKIERASMDGSNRMLLVNSNTTSSLGVKIGWPNGLAIDYNDDIIYWVDARSDIICRMNLDGSNLTVLIKKDNVMNLNLNLNHMYSITIMDNMLYWTDWAEKSIMMMDKNERKVTARRKLIVNVRDIHAYHPSRQPGTNACKDNGGCAHLCLAISATKKRCICTYGKLSSDGLSCEDLSDYLIFAKRNEIQFLDLNPLRRSSIPYHTIKSLHNAIGIDFDFKNQIIYYSDISKKEIGSITVNGTNQTTLVTDLKTPDGIALDWTTGMLYWTDAQENTVNRLTVNGTKQILVHKELDEPRAIALSPCDGLMYWTDWGRRPYIRRATVDGINQKAIIETNLGWPNGLCVDMEEKRIYWADARTDRIESATLDGLDRRIVKQNVPHVFGVSLYEEHIYWTDWVTRSVMRASKYDGSNPVALKQKLDAQPMDIKVFSAGRQNCSRTSCYLNGGCEDHCQVVNKSAVCACESDRQLFDGYHCVALPIVEECQKKINDKSTFICSDGKKCFPRSNVCDGEIDCDDKSDEKEIVCQHHKCGENYFTCQSDAGKCVLKRWQCDGEDDCSDGSDEKNCSPVKCNDDQIQCRNHKCIQKKFRCDGDNDCLDNTDELDCPAKTCRPNYFKCVNSTGCIRNEWVCDGHNDCTYGSDELSTNCISINCTHQQFQCKDQKKCLPLSWKCDGDSDCFDGSDEKSELCESYKPRCNANQHQCADGHCISKAFVCDGEDDCSDASDEKASNCSKSTCDATQFTCVNVTRCIPSRYQCDGDNDCGDGSDEDPRYGCSTKKCNVDTQFKCANQICIRKEWQCDGDDDCGDNSDEQNCTCNENIKFKCRTSDQCIDKVKYCDGIIDCSDESDEIDCKCPKGKFKCLTSKKCINEDKVCNNVRDCSDNSDEIKCNINECLSKSTHNCIQTCTDLKQGYQCSCQPGYYLNDDGISCTFVCDDYKYHRCSQKCQVINTDTENVKFQCVCDEGYTLANTSCKSNNKDSAYLIIASKHYINILSDKYYETIKSRLRYAISIDFDWKTQTYYWVDLLPGEVRSAKFIKDNTILTSKTEIKSIISRDIPNPFDLTVDWVGRNIYVTDQVNDCIYVSNLEGTIHKKIYKSRADQPLGIVCHPKQAYLYFTTHSASDKKSSSISRIGMDGSQQKRIVSTDLSDPRGLAIDFTTDTLYWSDITLKKIEYMSIAKTSKLVRKLLLSSVGEVSGLTIFEDYLYYTTWQRPYMIHRTNKFTGEDSTVFKKAKDKFFSLKMVHELRQPQMHNACASSGCQSLCLLSPTSRYKCDCADNVHLGSDGKSCVSNCTTGQYKCDNFKCISKSWYCDGEDDCGDNSDEKNCPTKKCKPDMYQCKNGNCTRSFYICDGENDCGDNSDEVDCENRKCFSFQFRCKNHSCILNSLKCDGKNDCGDDSDEENCPSTPSDKCLPSMHKCANGGCISKNWLCDGDKDCTDGSDELPDACKNATCRTGYFKCDNSKCVSNFHTCDGDNDCNDNSDESPSLCQNKTCSNSQIKCDKTRCVPKYWRCDGDTDCIDKTDELSCVTPNCTADKFTCANHNCINADWQCDFDDDCGDNSDELNCPQSTCETNGGFKCGNKTTGGICLHKEWKCDGQLDCKDKSDEKDCDYTDNKKCGPNEFKCHNKLCIHQDWLCDNVTDCLDGSDEGGVEFCSTHGCNPELQFQCVSDKLCIRNYRKCDGIRDCSDGSDEGAAANCKPQCGITEFKCGDGSCIDQDKRCDFYQDCKNNADEKDCGKLNNMKNTSCEGRCMNSRCNSTQSNKWIQCHCAPGLKFNESRVCVDINECIETPEVCQQKCVNAKESHRCDCVAGYEKSASASGVCKAKAINPAVLFIPTAYKIMKLSTHLQEKKQIATYIDPGWPVDMSSFDFFTLPHGRSMMIVGDTKKNLSLTGYTINKDFFFKVSKRKRRTSEPLFDQQFSLQNIRPEHIAVDYIGNNVYWANNQYQYFGIYMHSLESKHIAGDTKKLVLKRYLQIDGLALNPEKGMMYWCENALNPMIYQAHLDGSNIKSFVKDRLEYPVSLVFDVPSQRLFWVDYKKHTVESINVDGESRIVLLDRTKLPSLLFPSSIDVFEGYVYGIMKLTGTLFKVDMYGKQDAVIIKEDLPKTTKIKMYYENRHATTVKGFNNPCKIAYCPQMCVVVPNLVTGVIQSKCICDETNRISCEKVACNRMFCNGHGNCNSNSTTLRYQCKCDDGYRADTNCKEEYGHCGCLHGGTCNKDGSCTCYEMFVGKTCGHACHSFEGCINGECQYDDKNDKLFCSCAAGWKGDSCNQTLCDGVTCPNGECYNDENITKCRCNTGYKISSYDPKNCVSACDTTCPQNYKCMVNTTTSIASCICPSGNCVSKAPVGTVSKKLTIIIPVLILAILIIAVVIVVCIKRKRARDQFAPKKIINIETENPAFDYQNFYNGADDSMPESDRYFMESKNFANPMFYEGTSSNFPDEYEPAPFDENFSEKSALVADDD